jgi:Mor family transcriptional regulator
MDSTLSLECGRRICKITGGEYDDTIIYLLDKRKNTPCCEKCNTLCHESGKKNKKCCNNCNVSCQATKNNDMYLCLKNKNEYFEQMPNNEEHNSDALMIVGKRGSGKSYYLSKYIKQYILCYPKNPIYLISLCKDDPLLVDIITKQIDLDTYLEEGGLTHENIPNNSCVIFDDADVIPDDKLRKSVYSLMNQLIQLSRKRDITVVQTSHIGRNHGETKHALNGCSTYTFFYGSVSHQIKDTLKIYLGLTQQNIKKILELKDSRYCTIFTTTPAVVLTEKEVFILNNN